MPEFVITSSSSTKLLSDEDVASMRAVAVQALPQTAVIYTPSFLDDGGGGGTLSYVNAGTVACRVAFMSGTERESANKISPDADFIVTLPVTAQVDTESRLVIDANTYNVEAIRDRSWEITQRVEVVKQ